MGIAGQDHSVAGCQTVKYWEISSSRKGAGAVRYSNGDYIHEEGGGMATTEAGQEIEEDER